MFSPRESSSSDAMAFSALTRRSSRARTTQPDPPQLHHSNSSASSSSHSRAGERNTRSNHPKIPSPKRSSANRSHSLDDGGLSATRHRQRIRGGATQDEDDFEDAEDDAEDEEGDEEVTRCLCKQQEYPGLPSSRREVLNSRGRPSRDEGGVPSTGNAIPDDVGSMFIQCDTCKVWQHGGCVGIMNESMSPDEYFCERCRKDLHRIRPEPNGLVELVPRWIWAPLLIQMNVCRRYSSQYLPVAPASPDPSSRGSTSDSSRRPKDRKSRQTEATAAIFKRRSTNNSRDAAYDEEEQLRRAIEESKEASRTTPDEAARRGKRGRSDSEA